MARVRRAAVAEHLSPEELDLWVTGFLPAARETHLRDCEACQAFADQERLLVLRLEALPLFDPAPGFTDRVMDRVNVPVTSLAGAWRLWRTRFSRNPASVGVAASVAVMLGGSIAASAAWAAGHQDVITGVGTWMVSHGEQWFWQGIGIGTAFLEQQRWYPGLRTVLTPGWLAGLGAVAVGLYAGGVMMLRRLLALPGSPPARALP